MLYSWWIIPKAATVGDSGAWLKYDQVIHAYGFGIATWLSWQILCGTLRARGQTPLVEDRLRPTPGLIFLLAAAGTGLSALNEVIEFAADPADRNQRWRLREHGLGSGLQRGRHNGCGGGSLPNGTVVAAQVEAH